MSRRTAAPSAACPRSAPPARAPLAWVVFCGKAELWWLRVLRPGFRHCFVLLPGQAADRVGGASARCAPRAEGWLIVDPLAPRLDIAAIAVPPEFDLPGWYARQPDMLVAPARLRPAPPSRPAPWGAFTCVETVKRVLGIHALAVQTPWQLFRFLTRPG